MARGPLITKLIAGVAVTAGTPANVWTPTAGSRFRLCGWDVGLSVAGAVIFKDNATEVARTGQMAAGTARSAPPLGEGILSAVADQVLTVDVTASGTVHGFVWGFEE